jgi:hypothetical protein
MKIAGSYNINDYLNRLQEGAEANTETTGKVPVEGIIIPEENKKSFDWLKKEYQKGKTEVKVEMKMGGSSFEPAMNLQTNLKNVNNFKSGMFGDVKTSDTEGSKKKEEGTDGSKEKSGNSMASKDKPTVKGGEAKSSENKKGAVIKDGEAGEKKDSDKNKDKKEFKKGKVSEGLQKEDYDYLRNLPSTRKPELEDLFYCKKIKANPILESILSNLPVKDFKTYEELLSDFSDNLPKTFFIAKVLEDEGVSFLVNPEGYDHARYIAELI